jgi:hypothetical protein
MFSVSAQGVIVRNIGGCFKQMTPGGFVPFCMMKGYDNCTDGR